jgi:hypothetical protein
MPFRTRLDRSGPHVSGRQEIAALNARPAPRGPPLPPARVFLRPWPPESNSSPSCSTKNESPSLRKDDTNRQFSNFSQSPFATTGEASRRSKRSDMIQWNNFMDISFLNYSRKSTNRCLLHYKFGTAARIQATRRRS